MYVITRKRTLPIFCQSLEEAVGEAVKIQKPSCWIWKIEVTRLGTLKRIEVTREEIQKTKIEGIYCIENRFSRDQTEPAEGQVYFTARADKIMFLVYHQQGRGEEERL